MKKNIKFLSFIPALIFMVMIFIFSSQNADDSSELSAGLTYKLVTSFDHIAKRNWTSEIILKHVDFLEHFVRKLAHFTEYAILCISINIPLSKVYHKRELKYCLIAALVSSIYSITDEFHQLFVPGRWGSPKDVLIDSSGALLASIIMYTLSKICKNNDIG